MYEISDDFTDQVKNSHTMITKTELYSGGEFVQYLYPYDGSVSMDYESERQRRFTLYLPDPEGDLTPDELSDLLSVTGNEVKIFRGIRLADGTEEYIPLGVFPIDSTDITESGDGHVIRLEGFDRSSIVSANKFKVPYVIPAGTLYVDAIRELILDRYPEAEFHLHTVYFETPQIVFSVDRDPWTAAMSLGRDIGCDLAFDGHGHVLCTPTTDPATTDPVWEYSEGEEAMFLSINKRWTNTDLVNYWIVTGESADDELPVSAEAFDNDPGSPTYIYGNHGIHLKRYKSNTIKTVAQAQTVAQALLFRSLGTYETVRFNSIVNPAHEPADVINIQRDRIGVNNHYAMQKLTIPLTAQRAMEVTLRQR